MPCQQDEVYAAERGLSEGNTFASIEEAQVWVHALRETWWWTAWLQEVKGIEIGHARKNARFRGVGWYDFEEKWGRCEFRPDAVLTERLVIHEMSHVIASWRVGESAHHSPWFARVYLELTYLIRGTAASQALMLSFMRHHVDFDADGIAHGGRT